jgi:hypothetical protein
MAHQGAAGWRTRAHQGGARPAAPCRAQSKNKKKGKSKKRGKSKNRLT